MATTTGNVPNIGTVEYDYFETKNASGQPGKAITSVRKDGRELVGAEYERAAEYLGAR